MPDNLKTNIMILILQNNVIIFPGEILPDWEPPIYYVFTFAYNIMYRLENLSFL